ncbi:kinase domain protein [Dictyocaulus viviparus]|uniref:Aurora kinase n=1 Tax=Dictyocaulus viviparus TaxID=29172 RepID=A0A0D8X6Y3_DICVI|nr:kinase domain protein [Dictyocaulus viviparus]
MSKTDSAPTSEMGCHSETSKNSTRSDITDSTLSRQAYQIGSQNVFRTWTIDDFEIGRILGRGRFGSVFAARSKQDDVLIALKILFKEQIDKYNVRHQVKREIKIQHHLRHPNILRLIGYFHDPHRVYILLEFAHGVALYDRLKEKGRLGEGEAAKYVHQLADALKYCHTKNVIHRDIKPESVLIDRDGNAKIADFGWAVESNSPQETFCGTLDYLAPEMINRSAYNHTVCFYLVSFFMIHIVKKGHIIQKTSDRWTKRQFGELQRDVDNWALGVLLHEMLIGRTPFESTDENQTLNAIIECKVAIHDDLSEGPRDLIKRLVVKKPFMRLPLSEVLTHAWVVYMITRSNSFLNRHSFHRRISGSSFSL